MLATPLQSSDHSKMFQPIDSQDINTGVWLLKTGLKPVFGFNDLQAPIKSCNIWFLWWPYLTI